MMTLEQLVESLEKVAEVKQAAVDAKDKDKPTVSKELDAVLAKEAAATNVTQAFEDGEKLAKEILEKLANDVIVQSAETAPAADAKQEAKTEETPVEPAQEKTAGDKDDKKDKKEMKDGDDDCDDDNDADDKPMKEKKAAETPTPAAETKETKEENMNKQAQDAGKSLAAAILEKLAEGTIGSSKNAGTVVNSVGAPANKINQDAATMVAQHDARVGPTPGRNGKVTEILDAIVAKARAQNVNATDQMESGGSHAQAEGKDPAQGTPAIPANPDVTEKQAAVQALIEAGCSWEDAVDLVKAAAVELEQEENTQVKLAAVQELIGQGIDFDTAVQAVQDAVAEMK